MNRILNFIVNDETYKISYPPTGKFVDITSYKYDITNGRYEQMVFSTVQATRDAVTLIEMEAYITFLCPELIKELKAPIRKLCIVDLTELLKAYKEQMEPWIKEWQKIFNTIIEGKDDKDEK